MRASLRLLPWLVAGLIACCAGVCLRWRWDGRQAAVLPFHEAMAVLADQAAPVHKRQAAAAILIVHCRLAVRALRGADDLRAQVDLLLPQLEAIIREPR